VSSNTGLWRAAGSLSDLAVEQLPCRVGMPGVTRRFVDEVEEHPAQVLTLSPALRIRGLSLDPPIRL